MERHVEKVACNIYAINYKVSKNQVVVLLSYFQFVAKIGADEVVKPSITGRALPPLPQPLQPDSAVTDEIINYGCSAVQGFFRSIALSVESSLQDTLRLVIVLLY